VSISVPNQQRAASTTFANKCQYIPDETNFPLQLVSSPADGKGYADESIYKTKRKT
jgi:hypothetical protein